MKLACLAALAATALPGQQLRPAFDVASVKPAPPPTGGGIYTSSSGGPGSRDPGTITYTNVALRDLIRVAYGLEDYQISAPAWLSSARFDIVAKLPPDSTKEQVALMWQSLLAERFKVTSHTDTREMSVFALAIAKNGPRLKESATEGVASNGRAVSPGAGSGGGSVSSAPQVGFSAPRADGAQPAQPGTHRMSGSRMTLSRLAEMLSRPLDRPVLDMTGLKGLYDIQLSYSADGSADGPAPPLAMAVEQELGLKLEPRKSQVEVLVIDHAEKVPTEN